MPTTAEPEQTPTGGVQRSPHATQDGNRHTCWSGQLRELPDMGIMLRVLNGLRRL